MPVPNRALHAALRQIERKIRKRVQRGMMRISALDPDAEIKRICVRTYQEARRKADECEDPAQRSYFFSNAGVDNDTIRELLGKAAACPANRPTQ